jgi:hypothetical protein
MLQRLPSLFRNSFHFSRNGSVKKQWPVSSWEWGRLKWSCECLQSGGSSFSMRRPPTHSSPTVAVKQDLPELINNSWRKILLCKNVFRDVRVGCLLRTLQCSGSWFYFRPRCKQDKSLIGLASWSSWNQTWTAGTLKCTVVAYEIF